MTIKMIKSRRVLADCELALEKFSLNPIASEFRLILVNCFALLRAIGHVAKSEAEEYGILYENKIIWNQIKNDDLFIHFIDEFRNNVLKEYKSAVSWASVTSEENHRMEYLINEGFYKNHDVRELIQESVKWWRNYLDQIESVS